MNKSGFLNSTVVSDEVFLEGNNETSDSISTASATAATSPFPQKKQDRVQKMLRSKLFKQFANKELSYNVI